MFLKEVYISRGSITVLDLTQLVYFDHICAVCLRTAPAGGIVNATKLIPALGPDNYFVSDLKDTDLDAVLTEYKQNRVIVLEITKPQCRDFVINYNSSLHQVLGAVKGICRVQSCFIAFHNMSFL